MVKKAEPGISRAERITDIGLDRLEKQLESGINISGVVLAQWIKRYGDSARRIIKKHHRYQESFDRIK